MLWKPRENRSLTEASRPVYPPSSPPIRGKNLSKNKCGPGQPPEPHRPWISRPAFPPLGASGRWSWSAGAQECRIYQYWLQNRDSENHSLHPLR